jgi:UDPglucose--hexose-1-phosphate uridylyltransferase
VHHIKKENIGLIEVMGLAVLPARLKKEMKLVGEELAKGTEDISGLEEIKSHADWYKKLRSKYPAVKAEETEKILQREIGKVFEKVLTHAGVYKRTAEGMEAFDRFVASV